MDENTSSDYVQEAATLDEDTSSADPQIPTPAPPPTPRPHPYPHPLVMAHEDTSSEDRRVGWRNGREQLIK